MFESFLPKGVSAHMSPRSVDFVLPADQISPEFSGVQKEYLAEAGIFPEKMMTIRQVHGKKVLVVTKRDLPQENILEADGAVTAEAGVYLSVRTADCIPVFIVDAAKGVIGLLHAGWRGVAERIISEGVKVMQQNFETHAADLKVVLGPSIRSCCYEVGEEFKDIFPHEVSRHQGKLVLDLPLAAKKELFALGVPPQNILDSQQCTSCRPMYYSYRRDQGKAGRHLSTITRTSAE